MKRHCPGSKRRSSAPRFSIWRAKTAYPWVVSSWPEKRSTSCPRTELIAATLSAGSRYRMARRIPEASKVSSSEATIFPFASLTSPAMWKTLGLPAPTGERATRAAMPARSVARRGAAIRPESIRADCTRERGSVRGSGGGTSDDVGVDLLHTGLHHGAAGVVHEAVAERLAGAAAVARLAIDGVEKRFPLR